MAAAFSPARALPQRLRTPSPALSSPPPTFRAPPKRSAAPARMAARPPPAAPSQAEPRRAQESRPSPPFKPLDWLEQWYPVACVADVDPRRPRAFSIFQRNYVLFRDSATGTFVVMDDVCPHRAAPLSEGRLFDRERDGVTQTILECGYHGWRFDCSGRCVDIPVVELERRIPASADVGGLYATSVQFDGRLVFAYLGDRRNADESKIPLPEELMAISPENVSWTASYSRTLPTNFATILENLVDPAHIQWAHHGIQGNRDSTTRDGIVEMLECSPDEGMFTGGVRVGDEDHRLILQYQAPVTVFGTVRSLSIGGLFLLLWAVPVDHGHCEVYSLSAFVGIPRPLRLLFRLMPRFYSHTITHLVLDSDTPMLSWLETHLETKQRTGHGGAWKSEYTLASGTWDTFVVTMRQWIDEQAAFLPYISRAEDEPLRRLSREEINDRYTSHTRNCRSCSAALRNLKRALVLSFVAAGVAAGVAMFSGLTFAALVGRSAGVSARPLRRTGIVGSVICLVFLLVGKKIRDLIQLLVYTDVATEMRLAD